MDDKNYTNEMDDYLDDTDFTDKTDEMHFTITVSLKSWQLEINNHHDEHKNLENFIHYNL